MSDTDIILQASQALVVEPVWHTTGLMLPPTLTVERWFELGTTLHRMHESLSWWAADFVLFGEDHYGDMAVQKIAEMGWAPQTLLNVTWVANRFPPSRRRESLSFAHHAEVAALEPAEADAWLDQAEAGHWGRTELRARVRAARHGDKVAAVDWQARAMVAEAIVATLREAGCLSCGASLHRMVVEIETGGTHG